MKVLILMGSESDLQVMEVCKETLEALGIPSRMTVASAHRTPERVLELVREAERKGAQVIICGAGMAAHLAGAVAAQTILPVIGVPLSNSPLSGMDSLLSTVQMPPGVPVATVSIGKAGAKNAAVLAAQIIARSDRDVLRKLRAFRKRQSAEVQKRAERIEG
ncbi:MAG: 5-(carboxyamino)imidazole ribonucleotide mutase [Nitrospirota bacterium]|jgi:phosphoribosylaminoimidazole carboxylase PurE protein